MYFCWSILIIACAVAFFFSLFPVMLYDSYTQRFSLSLLYCCYSYCVSFVRSLMALVCQEIKGLLTYLLT